MCPWPPLHLATATSEGENDLSEVNAMNDKAAELEIGQNVQTSWLRQKRESQHVLLAESSEEQELGPAAASTRTIEAGACQVAYTARHTGFSNNVRVLRAVIAAIASKCVLSEIRRGLQKIQTFTWLLRLHFHF
jgi:hypothetical protein